VSVAAKAVARPVASTRPLPEISGAEHAWYHAGDVRLHVVEAGAGEAVMLIHGFPEHHYKWHRLVPPLAQHRRLIVPDLRGFGWSEAPAGPYDKETVARDLVALLDVLGVERVSLVGYDWGAWISWLIAMLEPARVERIVAMSMFHPFHRLTPGWMASRWRTWHGTTLGTPLIGSIAVRPGTELNRRVIGWLDAAAWTAEERETYLAQYREPERARAATRFYTAVGMRDGPQMLRGRYRRLGFEAPTLFLVGKCDRTMVPPPEHEFRPYAPNMAVEVIDSGHSMLEEQGEHVLSRINDFLGIAAVGSASGGRRLAAEALAAVRPRYRHGG
jgi:pimeloyl-ACP methyl ester carboxylesterase